MTDVDGTTRSMRRMSAWELATGWIAGYDEIPVAVAGTGMTPRQALGAQLRDCLMHAPVMVAFSGGRDSSLLLAVAARVARDEGLPLPIPLVLRYPDDPRTLENEWQTLVLNHLDLEPEIVTVADGSDVIGPDAVTALQKHGVCFPPGMYARLPALARAKGCTLITGEGGDEILGARRVTPVARMLRRRRPPRGLEARIVGLALAPVPIRRMVLRRAPDNPAGGLPWLSELARRRFARQVADDAAEEPLHHAHSTWRWARRRAMTVGLRNQGVLAAQYDVRLVHPLMDNNVVASLAAYGGRLGSSWLSRAELMRTLASDLLPEPVLARTSKASFNDAAMNVHTRAFMKRWTGAGVDPTFVDLKALRREWKSDAPHPSSLGLLQRARLAEEGV